MKEVLLIGMCVIGALLLFCIYLILFYDPEDDDGS